jgi:RHS repeat-associated protein
MRQGNTLSYLLSDGLGSTTIALSSTGSVTAVQLFAPYGSWRYSKGSMPTDYTFTGQRLDRETGLLYYGARYYDPLSGRFTQADLRQNNVVGMDPYAYVGENPETLVDPNGQMVGEPGAFGAGSDAAEAAAFESGSGSSLTDASSSTPIPYFSPEPSTVQAGNTTISYDANTGQITTQVDNADGSTTWSEVEPGTQAYNTDLQTFESLSEGSPDESTNAFAQGQTTDSGPTTSDSTQTNGPATTNSGDNTPGNTGNTTEVNTTNTTSPNEVRVSQKGLDTVKAHLSRPEFTDPDTGELGTESPENAAMIQRLEEALNQGDTISGVDANFYFHELYESTLMDRGLSYDEAHEQALIRYGVSEFALYHPDVIQTFPYLFNSAWFDFWGILP